MTVVTFWEEIRRTGHTNKHFDPPQLIVIPTIVMTATRPVRNFDGKTIDKPCLVL